MKYFYDQDHDALSLMLAERRVSESREVWPGIVVDFDAAGRPVGFDIDSGASALVDVKGLTPGREVRVSGSSLMDSERIADGADLRLRRESLGMTQAELASALGTTANTIARWERGELRVEHPRMLALAIGRLASWSEQEERAYPALRRASGEEIREHPRRARPRKKK
ncbi:MAG: DUF2283 domain-containing protein [Thermoanaerobaculia bacterium]